ncbi:MAG: zinc-ribbon domain-containing protein [Deltaproteobacteria bacterium]|nr:zinc-ribbon domain-containing protein [Deltaproteobacteria bacterium]
MIIQCDKCHTKFRLDDSKVKGAGVKVRCTKCQNVFIVTPPIEEVAAEEILAQSSADRKKAAERAREKTGGKENLSFEFSEAPKEPSPEKDREEEKGPGAPFADIGADTGGPGLDFSFKGFSADEESGKGAEEGAEEEHGFGEPADSAERTLGGFDLGLGAGVAEKEELAVEEEPSMGLGGYAGEVEEAEQGRKAGPAMEVTEERGGTPFSVAGYGGAGGPAKPTSNEEVSSGDFSEALKESVERGGEKPPHTEEVYYDEGAAKAPSAQGRAWVVLAVAVLVVIIGLGVLYFRGAGKKLNGGLISRDGGTAAKKTVDIESINGYFIDNKNAGKVFVIEARIKNVSEAAQEIKSVKGVLYNARGVKLTERSVAPGRVVSADDLKTLPREELLKQFKDPSGGSIPPKGTIPVMVLFTEAPAGMAEYGVDIVR